MKLAVLNASPKGDNSITLQYIRYCAKHMPSWTVEIFNVGRTINTLANDPACFDEILSSIASADCVVFCYPVYTFLVPYQLVKFLSLVFERGKAGAFAGKYAVQLSTSMHFFDHTAYNYIHAMSEDLGMKHLRGLCAHMDDLLTEEGRSQLRSFCREIDSVAAARAPVSRKYLSFISPSREYRIPESLGGSVKESGCRIVLVTDAAPGDINLNRMIDTFVRAMPYEIETVNLNDFPFKGGCLGCFNCAFEAKCVYTDGFEEFHRTKILGADCIIYAAAIDRHWLRPVWKCYDDRQFYNGHRTSFMHKSLAYIISGPLGYEPNLREIFEARAEVGHNYLIDIVTDEADSDDEIAARLAELARKTVWALREKPVRPRNFYGVGGMKIFRDLIFVMRGLMQEDHRFYKKHGLYDFPHTQRRRMLKMLFLGFLMKNKSLRKKSALLMGKAIIKKYSEVLEKY